MKPSRFLPSDKQVRRRWHVPPALIHGSEALEGGGVLQEFSSGTGLLLWQALRDVTLWAHTPVTERKGLFSADAERRRVAEMLSVGPEPGLEEPLGVITTMVGRPDRVHAEHVALACRQVGQWAEARGNLATALSFFQAGALACPGDACSAFKVGQIARKRAENARAESWFRRTIALARQAGDWSSYALAFSGLGTLYLQRGNLPAAHRFQIRCFRAAKRHNLREIAGGALHDLHVIATVSGQGTAAQYYAREAFEQYGPNHPRLSNLAHDIAYFWLTQGCFGPALAVFQALLPAVSHAAERLTTLSNICRAAGGAGDRASFSSAWDEVWSNADEQSAEAHAEAFLELAHGALSLGEWDRAELAANRALTTARLRGEARVDITAESVIESIRHDRLSVEVPASREAATSTEAHALAEDLVRCLSLNSTAP